ncbi:MAG: hypothetical protein AB1545_00235 [Thermodesulfobacteriota bacterium]
MWEDDTRAQTGTPPPLPYDDDRWGATGSSLPTTKRTDGLGTQSVCHRRNLGRGCLQHTGEE